MLNWSCVERFCHEQRELKGRNVVIFGAGTRGSLVCKALKKELNPVCFCDNNQSLWGKNVEGIVVKSPQEISKLDHPLVIVGASPIYYKSIFKQLNELGLECMTVMQWMLENKATDLHDIYDSCLADDYSKEIYVASILNYCGVSGIKLKEYFEPNQYFILPHLCDTYQVQTFVDCGAYVGDTVEKFLEHSAGIFEKIYAFEPGDRQFKAMTVRTNRLRAEWAIPEDRIILVNAGVGHDSQKKLFLAGKDFSSTKIMDSNADNAEEVCVISLDDYFRDNPVVGAMFIKSDIEGDELELLMGAEKTIKKHRPLLAISIYHSPTDLYKIPQYIHSLGLGYHMVIRHHAYTDSETVLYCY